MNNKYKRELEVSEDFIKLVKNKLNINLNKIIYHKDIQNLTSELKKHNIVCQTISDPNKFEKSIKFEIIDKNGNKTLHSSEADSIIERCYDAIYLQLCSI